MDLSSQVRLATGPCESPEASSRVVHQKHSRRTTVERHDGDAGGVDDRSLEEVEVCAGEVRDEHSHDVAMCRHEDGTARVAACDSCDLADRARLSFGEPLATREPKL